jgi:hypothetical protein
MKGYLKPCGCSYPQIGGLERRYNFFQTLKDAGWPMVAVDLGDLAQRKAPADLPNLQGLLKYTFAMRMLQKLDYTAISLGETEAAMGFYTVLGEFALNESSPRVVVGNLLEPSKYDGMVKPWEIVERAGLRVGVTGMVGPSLGAKMKALDNEARFEKTSNAMATVIKDMNAHVSDMMSRKVDVPVLLYQGPVTRNAGKKPYTEAMAVAEAFPEFPIVVASSEEDEAPANPVEVTTKTGSKSLVITLGGKGKFVGLVGVWKTGKKDQPLTFKYERVEITPSFKTPEDKAATQPIVKLLEEYTKKLKDDNYLEKFPQRSHPSQVMPAVADLDRPGEVLFVGSDKCKSCHKKEYAIWEKSGHAHAYKTLEDAKHPGNRQFDPECIVCHVVGFGYKSGFVSETKTPRLKDVGCESCHGPGSLHVANANDQEWQKRMNPWKYLPVARNKQLEAIDQFCQKCHDMDNDVNWLNGGFERKWKKIAH